MWSNVLGDLPREESAIAVAKTIKKNGAEGTATSSDWNRWIKFSLVPLSFLSRRDIAVAEAVKSYLVVVEHFALEVVG